MEPTIEKAEQAEKRFFDIVRGFENAMLVTHAGGGRMHARPMAVAAIDYNGDVWFVTRVDTTKIDEIALDRSALVLMQEGDQFLSLSGRADVVRDPGRIEELWSEKWRIWSDDKRDPGLVLIRVHSQEAEYWDNTGLNGLKFLFDAAKAYVTGDSMRPSENLNVRQHAKVPLSH